MWHWYRRSSLRAWDMTCLVRENTSGRYQGTGIKLHAAEIARLHGRSDGGILEAKEEEDAALPDGGGEMEWSSRPQNASTFPVGTVPDDAVKIFLDTAHQWLV